MGQGQRDRQSVILTREELEDAGSKGVSRQVAARFRPNAVTGNGLAKEKPGYDQHVLGAMGELAVAKFFNVYWNIGSMSASDVGEHLEVRTISLLDTGGLMLTREDKAVRGEKYFVLVEYRAPEMRLIGWIRGQDAFEHGTWQELQRGRDTFVVPRTELHTDWDALWRAAFPSQVPETSDA